MLFAVVIFVIGSAIQAGAVTTAMIFVGRAIAGIPVGMLTMVVPQYMSEVRTPVVRTILLNSLKMAILSPITCNQYHTASITTLDRKEDRTPIAKIKAAV